MTVKVLPTFNWLCVLCLRCTFVGYDACPTFVSLLIVIRGVRPEVIGVVCSALSSEQQCDPVHMNMDVKCVFLFDRCEMCISSIFILFWEASTLQSGNVGTAQQKCSQYHIYRKGAPFDMKSGICLMLARCMAARTIFMQFVRDNIR